MKTADLRTKSEDELKKNLIDLRKEQFNLRFQQSTGAVENTSLVRKARRGVAKIKTILNEKQSAEKPAKKTAAKAKKKN